MIKILILAVMLSISSVASSATLNPYFEYRYCGSPDRYASGGIKRSGKVTRAFAKIHPCPSNGLFQTSCPGWQMNHVIPLACGGCDSVTNLQWLPKDIKTCSEKKTGHHCVDRFERKINAHTPPFPDTRACVNKIVK